MRRLFLVGIVIALLQLMSPAAQAAPRLQCGAVITESTTLKADLTCSTGPALQIQTDGAPVVLDLGGHKVTGGGTGVGILATRAGASGPVTVRNGTITGFSTAVSLSYVPGSRIADVTMVGPGRSSSGSVGLMVQASPTYVLDHVTVKSFSNGLRVVAGDGGKVRRSTFSDNRIAVFLTPSVYSFTIDHSRVTGNGAGFALSQSTMTVLHSEVSHNDVGISLFQSDAIVRRSTLAHNGTAIDASSVVSSINLTRSTIRANDVGVRLLGVALSKTDNAITGNTFKGNGGPGLVVDLTRSLGTPALRIADNRFIGNGARPVDVGVPGVSDQGAAVRAAEDAGSVVVADNDARRNAGVGIDVVGATDGGGNTARGNGDPSQCIGVACGR